MQMQILSTSAMTGLGKVLSFTDPVEGEPVSSEFRAGEIPLRHRSEREVVVDYESGMCILILYTEDDPLIFYLDRKVMLFPGTSFSVVPLGSACSARIYLRSGARLETEEYDHPQLSAGTTLLRIDRIYTCFYQESARDFYYRGERHTPYELTYVDHGELHNLVNGTDILLRQGEIAIIPRNEWHMQYSDEQVNFLTVTFDLEGDILSPVCGKAMALPSSARPYLKRFLQERSYDDPFAPDYLESLLKVLLIELLRAANAKPSHETVLLSTARAENHIMDQALQIIAARSHHPPSLKELANEVHVSVPYLCRLFNTHLGIPPGQYIIKIRLEECKALLRQGELSMGDIAIRMGFSSAQQFSRQFRNFCGLTPTEYTRSLR